MPLTLAIEPLGLLVIMAMILVAIVGGVIAWQGEQKRIRALRDWAAEHGWRLDESKRSGTAYPSVIFERGHSRYSRFHATNSFAGVVDGIEDPTAFDLFQYHYAITTSSGKSSQTTHYWFVCAAVNCGIDLGQVDIREEHFGDRIAQVFGSNDIDFEDPDFSKRFHVTAVNRKDAFDLISHAMMDWMMNQGDQGITIATRGRLLFMHHTGKMDAARYDRLARFAGGFLQQIPRTLVNAERARQGLPPLMEAGAAATRARHARSGHPRPDDPPPQPPGTTPEGAPGAAPGDAAIPPRNPDPDGPARLP
ncbi:MAG: hypothetical protein ACTS3F_01275 [Phycisphaerales bacterium]